MRNSSQFCEIMVNRRMTRTVRRINKYYFLNFCQKELETSRKLWSVLIFFLLDYENIDSIKPKINNLNNVASKDNLSQADKRLSSPFVVVHVSIKLFRSSLQFKIMKLVIVSKT